jgi:hypothetical protein
MSHIKNLGIGMNTLQEIKKIKYILDLENDELNHIFFYLKYNDLI